MEVQTFLDNVEWSTKPLQRTARSLKLLRCEPYNPVYGWWVSDQVVRMLLHWDGMASWPHLKESLKCPGCRQGMPLREKGYGAMILEKAPKLVIVELTEGCMRDDVMFDSTCSHIRGRFCTVMRQASKKGQREHRKSHVVCQWGPKQAPKQLPEDFDIRPTLGLIFGLVPDMHGYTRFADVAGGDA